MLLSYTPSLLSISSGSLLLVRGEARRGVVLGVLISQQFTPIPTFYYFVYKEVILCPLKKRGRG